MQVGVIVGLFGSIVQIAWELTACWSCWNCNGLWDLYIMLCLVWDRDHCVYSACRRKWVTQWHFEKNLEGEENMWGIRWNISKTYFGGFRSCWKENFRKIPKTIFWNINKKYLGHRIGYTKNIRLDLSKNISR